MWVVSSFCLLATAFACLVAVFSRSFNDNLLQRIGLGLISIGATGVGLRVWNTGFVSTDAAWVHVGMFVMALGTAIKVYGNYRKGMST